MGTQQLVSSSSIPAPKQRTPRTDHSTSRCQNAMVLIVYLPDDPGQLLMAQEVAKGIEDESADGRGGVTAILEPVGNVTFAHVLDFDGVILGSSVENGNTHPLLQDWINKDWDLGR